MRLGGLIVALALAALPVAAQEEVAPEDPPLELGPVPETGAELPEAGTGAGSVAAEGRGAVVRWLDKVSGATGDLDLAVGQVGQTGRLSVLLDDCRYPADGNPTDAFAHLVIMDSLVADPVFTGWMVAESPALNALDHSRYDVWVLRCLTE